MSTASRRTLPDPGSPVMATRWFGRSKLHRVVTETPSPSGQSVTSQVSSCNNSVWGQNQHGNSSQLVNTAWICIIWDNYERYRFIIESLRTRWENMKHDLLICYVIIVVAFRFYLLQTTHIYCFTLYKWCN